MTLTDLSDEILPFPPTGTLLSTFQTPSQTEYRSKFPLQKLRPVRSNQYVKEYSKIPITIDSKALPENKSLIDNLQYSHHQVAVGVFDSSQRDAKPSYYSEVVTSEDGGGGGENQWLEAETLALLRIRSEMDTQFRDENPKGPLWDIVSRKLEDLGFIRNGRKCKEKFENICQGGNLYKSFNELKALEDHGNGNSINETRLQDNNTIQTPDPVEISNRDVSLNCTDLFRGFSCGDDDDGYDGNCHEFRNEIVEPQLVSMKRKKRTNKKLKLDFENLVNEMTRKQEEMYKNLIEIMDKWEKDRIKMEEAWKEKEMERIKRDKEMRDEENSRSVALISFIEEFLGAKFHVSQSLESYQGKEDDNSAKYQEKEHESTEFKFNPSNRRWPETEIHALIKFRSTMDHKFRGTAPKLPVWEEVSRAMSSMGFYRTAKKCKEKWENINKYFRKTLASGKKHPRNEKSCPYYNELDILYKKRIGNSETPSDERNDKGDKRSSNNEMLTTLAQVCDLFSMSDPLEPVEGQSGSSLDCSKDIHPSDI